jgi:hypothetical protein
VVPAALVLVYRAPVQAYLAMLCPPGAVEVGSVTSRTRSLPTTLNALAGGEGQVPKASHCFGGGAAAAPTAARC